MPLLHPRITGASRGKNAYYTLQWSTLSSAEKYTVSAAVPAVSGIYELYYADAKNVLHMLNCEPGWYGGLRSQIREAIDVDFLGNASRRTLLESNKLYMRYSCSDILADMQDVLWFLHMYYFGKGTQVTHSGRYERIFVKEEASDNIHWV